MATTVQLAGATKIRVAIPNVNLGNGTGNLADFGWTRNGATVTYEDYFLDVPGDQHGGDDGPPIEVQWLGSIARIRCEMTKWDFDIFEEIAARVASTTFGLSDISNTSANEKTPGQLMFTGAKTLRVLLLNANDIRNFPRCLVRSGIECNYATKYTSPIIEFEAHADGTSPIPILHNKVTSG